MNLKFKEELMLSSGSEMFDSSYSLSSGSISKEKFSNRKYMWHLFKKVWPMGLIIYVIFV